MCVQKKKKQNMKSTSTRLIICMLLLLPFFGNTLQAQVVINEYSCSNYGSFIDNYGDYGDWIELYNTSSSAINLNGYYLSDNPNAPKKWQFPMLANIPANGFMRIWASGRNSFSPGNFHANFKLTQTKPEGEIIVFADPNGIILDQIAITITQIAHSNGRFPDGGDTWKVFTTPTPETANTTSSFVRYAEKPVMSIDGGFYTSPFTVSLTTTEPNSKIRYTTNGNEPTATSPIYSSPISITTTKVLKAKVFSNDAEILPGLIEFNTYFMNESFTLPVFSIAATDLTTLLNGNSSIFPWGSIEYYDTNQMRLTRGYGEFDKHGQDSWANPQRSLDYKMRDECGYNYALLTNFFSDTDRSEYQKVILRACGDDNYPGIDSSALIRDDFVETVSVKANMSLDERKSARCIVFANGQYWGVYSIREKPNDHDYTKYYYEQDKYNLYYLMLWGSTWAEYGGQAAFDDWQALYNFIMTKNMAIQSNFDYVESQYDPTSLTDYMLLNSYVVCSDWLNWNVAWWKGLNPDGGHKRWAYQLWDEDATFGHYINYTGIPSQSPTLAPCFHENISGSSDPEGHVKVLNRLLQNPGFEQYYIARYADLLNTAFKPENMIALFDSMVQLIQPEMQRHCTRWSGDYEQWNYNVQKVRNFIIARYNAVVPGLKSCYNITGPFAVKVNMDPPAAGQIQLNSLTLSNFPWTGNYYGGMDTKLTAIEINQQYKFDHWESTNNTLLPNATSKEITVKLTAGDSIVAVYVPRIVADSVVINEINYNSAAGFDPGDWVELYNPHPYPLDISNWVFKDEDDLHAYVFAQGTVLPANGYIVIAANMTTFHNLFPSVTNYVGPLGFNFAGGGELLRVYNHEGTLVDTVHYDDVAPWPTTPDGQGATLELIAPNLDNALGVNWKGSIDPEHGTPGEHNSPNVGLDKPVMSEKISLTVYPNPTNNESTLLINTSAPIVNATVSIYTLTGIRVYQISDVNSTQVKLEPNHLPAGCYIVHFTNHDGLLTGSTRLMVE